MAELRFRKSSYRSTWHLRRTLDEAKGILCQNSLRHLRSMMSMEKITCISSHSSVDQWSPRMRWNKIVQCLTWIDSVSDVSIRQSHELQQAHATSSLLSKSSSVRTLQYNQETRSRPSTMLQVNLAASKSSKLISSAPQCDCFDVCP